MIFLSFYFNALGLLFRNMESCFAQRDFFVHCNDRKIHIMKRGLTV